MGTRYKHPSASERDAIHRGRLEGQSPAAIAADLGRLRSTIQRGLERNGGEAGYDAPAAQRRYRRGRRNLAPGTTLWDLVVIKGVGVVNCLYVNPGTGEHWIIDWRIYNPDGDGKSKLGHVRDMFDEATADKSLPLRTVLMDSWYAT